MKIIAHRTGMAYAPENSIEGFQKCADDGADGAECDITMAGVTPFMWADDMNRILTKPVRSLQDLAPDAIRGLKRSDSPEKIAEMRDIWNFMSAHSDFHIFFDVKYYSRRASLLSWPIDLEDIAGHFLDISPIMIAAVLDGVVRPCPAKTKIGFVTFQGGAELLKAVKQRYPEVHTNLIVIFPWVDISRYAEYCDSITIGWKRINHWKMFSASFARYMREAKANGISVYAGVANTREEICWARDHGCDGLWTDRVSFAKEVIGQ